MSQAIANRLLIAAPEATAEKLCGILSGAGIVPQAVYHSGEAALAALDGGIAILLTVWKLPDMTGMELAERAGEDAGVLLICPRDEEMGEAKHNNVLLLRNPLSPDALVQAVRTMLFCGERMRTLRKKVEKLERTLEDRKFIERAKGRLMDALKLNESDAHDRMQKKSMDSGRRIADVAREILELEDLSGF